MPLVLIKPAEQAGVDLAHVVFNQSIQLLGQIVVSIVFRQLNKFDQFRHGQTQIGPTDGLILRVFSRDVDFADEAASRDWRSSAWNRDMAWFRSHEMTSLLPANLDRVGATAAVPDELVERLARCHLVDNVRGQTPPYSERDVREIRLTATVAHSTAASAEIRYEGAFDIEKLGRWAIEGFRDMDQPAVRRRGYEGQLLGRATFDREHGKFESFELLALGRRYGATQYNGRHDDPEGTMAIAFTLAEEKPEDQIAPALIWAYGW